MALRLGLVGHGRWGRNIHRTLLTFPDVAVVLLDKGARPDTSLDGVLIATQSATHAALALPYIEAGIATFIEKPMTTALADAERIRDAATRSGAVVFVGHIFLFHPAFLAALELLPALGAVRYLLCEGMNNNPRRDSSVLWDWLPHDLSIARAVFGREPERVASSSLAGGAHAQAALSRFEFGPTSLVSTASWLSPVRRRRITIACEKGTIELDDTAERRLRLYDAQGALSHPDYSDELPLTREMAAFLRAVRSREGSAAHLQTGIAIVRAIAAAERSVALGGEPVAV
jgi:predicted dehydrogenase